jgi:hypothetical protein
MAVETPNLKMACSFLTALLNAMPRFDGKRWIRHERVPSEESAMGKRFIGNHFHLLPL